MPVVCTRVRIRMFNDRIRMRIRMFNDRIRIKMRRKMNGCVRMRIRMPNFRQQPLHNECDHSVTFLFSFPRC